MAKNDVNFRIRITDEASGGLKRISVSSKDLSNTISRVTDEVNKAQRSIVNWAQTAQAADMLGQSINDLYNWSKDVTQAYQIQLVAETQLVTVMRQRMKATDEEVQSIKDLCSAQQALGVIGDEVQLSGAQQMATFLNEKKSLDTLIPAMNNLLAQQHGLNSTNQDAVSIGNLMGKAMQGQTEVLQRVGISFSEAQKQVLKFGSESERAAVLAQVITENVGNMNSELAKTDAGKQKQLENTLGDMKEQIGAMVQPLMKSIMYLSQMVTILSGMGKAYASLRSLMLAFNGLTSASRISHTAVLRINATLTVLSAKLRGVAVGATTARMALSKLAIASGVGAAIAALSYAIYKLTGSASSAAEELENLTTSARQLKEASQAYSTASADAKAAIDMELASLKQLIDTHADDRQAVSELNRKYGESFGTYKTAAEWYEVLTTKSETYCRAIGMEAQARELATKKAQNELRLLELQEKMKQMRDAGTDTETTFSPMGAGVINTAPATMETQAYRTLREESEQLTATQDELAKKFGQCTAAMADARKEIGTLLNVAEDDKKIELPVALNGLDETKIKARLQQLQQAIDAAPTLEKKLELMPEKQQLEQTLADIQRSIDIHRFRLRFEDGKAGKANLDGEKIAPSVTIDTGRITQMAEEAKGEMQDLFNKPLKVKVNDKEMKGFDEKTRGAYESVGQLGSSLSQLGSAIGLPALDIMGVIAQSIANVALSYSQALAGAAAMGPWAWIAFAATGLAQMVAVIGSIKQATAFAAGGIVSGPTYALVGEYAGASNNPEVIAPLDKLRTLINTDQGGQSQAGRVTFRLQGRELLGLMEREGEVRRRR